MNGRTIQKEVEVKLELPPASLRALKKVPLFKTPPRHTSEVSVYFDTDKHKLRKNGLMLRVRRVRNRYVQTIKATNNSGPFERDEWETELAGQEPDLRMAEGTALERLANDKLQRQLKPLFETSVHRSVYPIVDDRRAIALTVDRGSIDMGNHSIPLCEIELELQRGKLADLFDVARELIRTLPARIAVKSKSQRGYELIDGTQDAPVKGKAIDLPLDSITRDGFKTIGTACLGQIIGNEPAVLRDDPEGVHQMRVGLRRLRAGMSLFSVLLRNPQTAAIKAELKWLAAELGPARELEVLVNRVITPIKKPRVPWEGVPSLVRQITKKRKAAVTRAKNAVQSARFRALTLEVAAWLQVGQWTTPQDDLVRDRGNLPITVFAAEQLTRRWRRLRKKRKALAQLDAPSRHRLRIQAKKLRYAVEFFASLFASKREVKRRRSLLQPLERLQDSLGELNDIAVDEQRLAATGIRRRSDPNRVFAAGLLTGREDARTEAAIAAATEAYGELAKAKPFWR
jgi:triphosphatase